MKNKNLVDKLSKLIKDEPSSVVLILINYLIDMYALRKKYEN